MTEKKKPAPTEKPLTPSQQEKLRRQQLRELSEKLKEADRLSKALSQPRPTPPKSASRKKVSKTK